jgi:hypothetical protein
MRGGPVVNVHGESLAPSPTAPDAHDDRTRPICDAAQRCPRLPGSLSARKKIAELMIEARGD